MTEPAPPAARREPIRTREAGWPALALFVAATSALLLLVPLARNAGPGRVLGGPAWWENLNLFGILLLATVGGVLFGYARLRPGDVGLRRGKLAEGAAAALVVWGLMQLWPYLAMGSAQLARTWATPGPAATLRWAAVMFLATALWEEVAFRGYLFPQLYLKLRGGHRVRLWGAVLASQLLFAAAHVPAHVMIRHLSGAPLLRMLMLQAIAGILLTLVYLRTRNLWIAIAFHGLANAPTPLVGGAMSWEILLLALLAAWPWVTRRRHQRGLARVEAGAPFRDRS